MSTPEKNQKKSYGIAWYFVATALITGAVIVATVRDRKKKKKESYA